VLEFISFHSTAQQTAPKNGGKQRFFSTVGKFINQQQPQLTSFF
jgi:hypothetical protein